MTTKRTPERCYGCGPTIPPCDQCCAKERLIAAAPELLAACEMVRDANQRNEIGVTISHETYAELLASKAVQP